jgi:hypothetical protein
MPICPSLRHLRIPALLMLALNVGACTRWEPITIAPRQFIESAHPKTVRVWYEDGDSRVLRRPVVQNDSIVEVGERCTNGRCEILSRTAPLDGITELEVPNIDNTPFVVVGAATLVFMAIIAAGCAFSGCSGS